MPKTKVKQLPELKPINYVDVVNERMLKAWLSNKTAKDRWKEIVYDVNYDNSGLAMLPKNIKLYKNIDPLILGTAIKDYVDTVLYNWKEDSDDTTAKELVASLPLFVEMSKVMPHVNPSEDYPYAFRGTEISDDKLKQFMRSHPNEKDWKKVKVGGSTFYSYIGPKKGQFQYKPHREVQSWSVTQGAAASFGSAIIATPIDKSFFFDPGFMSQYGYESENETIHFGKEPMKVALLIDKSDYDNARGIKGPWDDYADNENPTWEENPDQYIANEYYDGDIEFKKLDDEFQDVGEWKWYEDNEEKIKKIKMEFGRTAAIKYMKGELNKLKAKQSKSKIKESILTETLDVMDDDGTLTLPL